MKTFLEGVEGVEESFEMSDVDKRVAVVEENPHSWVQPCGWIVSIFQSRL